MNASRLQSLLRSSLVLIAVSLLFGCAHLRSGENIVPKKALSDICRPDLHFKEVKGSVWMKVRSKEDSGQFPADLVWNSKTGLIVEVTNLIGGPIAQIKSRDESYEIKRYDRPEEKFVGEQTWGGISISLAKNLFIGNIPCPQISDTTDAVIRLDSDGWLWVIKGAERYGYRLKNWAGRSWPEEMIFRKEGSEEVRIHFDQPEDKTGTPLRWEATAGSSELKVRWKERSYQLD